MRLALRMRPEATAELNEAWNWYEDRQAGLGDELLACVESALAAVRHNPEAFRMVDGRVRQALVRRFPYLILFVECPEYVEVLAVFHTSREPRQWLGRSGS